jgi:hypothetical protein
MLEKVLHRKLLSEGAPGRGVVTKVLAWGRTSDTGLGSVEYSLHGHITFDDGTHTEFVSRTLDSGKVGWFREGDIVPVRYDPKDHSKAVLDIPALEAQHDAEKQGRQDQEEQDKKARIAYAEAELTGSVPPEVSPEQRRAITAHRFAELNAKRRSGELSEEQFRALASKLLGE